MMKLGLRVDINYDSMINIMDIVENNGCKMLEIFFFKCYGFFSECFDVEIKGGVDLIG